MMRGQATVGGCDVAFPRIRCSRLGVRPQHRCPCHWLYDGRLHRAALAAEKMIEMRRVLRLAFGAALLGVGSHALWRIGFHQGLFFAAAASLIALGGTVMMISAIHHG